MPIYGKGVDIDETAEEIVIRIRKDSGFGPSASGKTNIVATTSGNVELDSGVIVGVNAYRRR